MEKLTDSSKIEFGKFKSEKLANVDADWLLWWYNQNKPLIDYIEDNMELLKQGK